MANRESTVGEYFSRVEWNSVLGVDDLTTDCFVIFAVRLSEAEGLSMNRTVNTAGYHLTLECARPATVNTAEFKKQFLFTMLDLMGKY